MDVVNTICFQRVASPILANLLQQAKAKDGMRYIKILGVPCDAICLFLRFLYPSWYVGLNFIPLRLFFFSLYVLQLHFLLLVILCVLSLCRYEKEKMKKFFIHLLVLSHSYSVPSIKRVCTYFIEQDWLTKGNVVDILQLSRNCDALQLSLFCVRMIVNDFKAKSTIEDWKVMKRANPALEQELLEYVVETDSVRWTPSLFTNIC